MKLTTNGASVREGDLVCQKLTDKRSVWAPVLAIAGEGLGPDGPILRLNFGDEAFAMVGGEETVTVIRPLNVPADTLHALAGSYAGSFDDQIAHAEALGDIAEQALTDTVVLA